MNSRANLYGTIAIVVLLSAPILSAGVHAAEPAAKLVFACRADSDLYRVLCAGGTQPPRYDTPAAAAGLPSPWWEIPTCSISHSCYDTGKWRKTP